MTNTLNVNGPYVVDWRTNLPNVLHLIAFTVESLSNKDIDVAGSAFIVPHRHWVDAGFSGCVVPNHIVLDHTDEHVGSAPLTQIESLKSQVEIWELNLKCGTHYSALVGGVTTTLCGIAVGELTDNVGEVTCPCCVSEIFSKSEKTYQPTINQ